MMRRPAVEASRQTPFGLMVAVAGLALGLGAVVAYSAPLALAILVVAGILITAVVNPRWLLHGIVFLGPLPIGATTGKQKDLFGSFGGVDAEGLRLLAVVLLAALLLLVIGARTQTVRRTPIRVAYGFVFVMLVWCGLELFRSPDLNLGLRLWFKIAYIGVVTLFAAEMTWSEEERRQMGSVALAAACLLLVIGWTAGIRAGFGSGRLDTFAVIHPTPFGLALVFYTAMSYALAPSRRRFVLYALLLVSALFTLERTVWLTMFLLASSFYVLRSKGTFRWLAPPLLALLAVTAVLTYKPFYNRFFYRALPSGQSLSLSTLPLNTNGRNAAWDSILHRVDRSTFLYGRGMGAADDYFQNVLHGSLNGVVHNEYLRLLYDAGILAPALLVLALILLIAAALRWRGDPTIRAVLVGMAVAYPFAALIDNAVDYYAYVGTGLAVLAGIFLSMSMHSQATRAEQDPPTEGFPERRLVTSGSR